MSTRIIVVEDEAITAMLVRTRLSEMGFTVLETCATGEDAVQAAETHAPDVVLMDINLAGEIDGIEAARLIGEKKAVPVIFVTGYSDTQYRDRARALNPAGFLVKPVDFPELEEIIRKHGAS